MHCHFISQRTKSLFMRATEVVFGIGESEISGWCPESSPRVQSSPESSFCIDPKQTIVHMMHMILSRSVHQIAYGDVIKVFCKKTSLQRTPPNNGHYCSSQRCPLFGGFTVNHKGCE